MDHTRRQERARTRQAARQALAAYDLEVRRLRLRLDEFNCLFRVGAADGNEYVLRLTNARGCHGVEETRAELAWLAALRTEAELQVPRPVRRRDGTWTGAVDAALAPAHRQYVLFEWLPGRTLGRRVGVRGAERLGRCSALLHGHAATFTPREGRARRFDRVFPYADEAFADREPVRLFDDEFRDVFTPDVLDTYRAVIDRATAETDRLFQGSARPRLIHNDLHPWNVIVTPRGLAPIDFEDLMWGFPVQDVATTLYYLRCREDGARLEHAFRDGYETVAPWPASSEAQLATLIAGRGLIVANTVLTAPDPAERAQAGHFIPLIGERMRRWMG